MFISPGKNTFLSFPRKDSRYFIFVRVGGEKDFFRRDEHLNSFRNLSLPLPKFDQIRKYI